MPRSSSISIPGSIPGSVLFTPVPLALATALLLATMAAPSRAQSQAPLQALPGAGGASAMASVPVQIRIASPPLAQALDTLARQARLELMVQPALVEGRTAPAVEGRLSASEALGRLLAGTEPRLGQQG